jgi:hypothetical protein
MKSSWGGLMVGALGLAVLEGVISRKQASSNVAGVLSGAGSAVKRFLDPTVPLFSTSTTKTATTVATTTTATGSSPVPASI